MLATIRRAVADLKRIGLTIESFVIEPVTLAALENEAILAQHVALKKGDTEIDIEKLGPFPRTICGIPLNVRKP